MGVTLSFRCLCRSRGAGQGTEETGWCSHPNREKSCEFGDLTPTILTGFREGSVR